MLGAYGRLDYSRTRWAVAPPGSLALRRWIAIFLAACLTATACDTRPDPVSDRAGGPPAFRRVVLISIDTLRADHLGVYGYPRPVSPFIDEIARDSVVFERAYASMATTSPAHATMFTGLHPIQHRVLRNGRRLSDRIETIGERLTARGYRTVGFASTRSHFGPTNLAQGFDHFEEIPRDAGHRRTADRTIDAALEWLANRDPDELLFLFLHLYDVHHPWQAPAMDLEQIAAQDSEIGFESAFWSNEHHIPVAFYAGKREQMRTTIDAYDAAIHFTDRQLRRLFDAVSNMSADPTLWIITADHGEGLGNHDWMFHGKHVYDEQVRVPLILHASDGRFEARRFGGLVRHIDLFPTIAALTTPDGPGAPLRELPGRSLLPVLEGTGDGAPHAFIQRRRFDPNPDADARALRGELRSDDRYEPGDTYAWIQGGWKLIHRTHGRDELFDLDADPYEVSDLIAAEPNRAERMLAELSQQLMRLNADDAEFAEPVDTETAEALRALGYLP